MTDCLVAAMALRLDVPVAHRDRDFEVIAAHCGLQTLSLL
jgi:predicted nucleic acid-binding protein